MKRYVLLIALFQIHYIHPMDMSADELVPLLSGRRSPEYICNVQHTNSYLRCLPRDLRTQMVGYAINHVPAIEYLLAHGAEFTQEHEVSFFKDMIRSDPELLCLSRKELNSRLKNVLDGYRSLYYQQIDLIKKSIKKDDQVSVNEFLDNEIITLDSPLLPQQRELQEQEAHYAQRIIRMVQAPIIDQETRVSCATNPYRRWPLGLNIGFSICLALAGIIYGIQQSNIWFDYGDCWDNTGDFCINNNTFCGNLSDPSYKFDCCDNYSNTLCDEQQNIFYQHHSDLAAWTPFMIGMGALCFVQIALYLMTRICMPSQIISPQMKQIIADKNQKVTELIEHVARQDDIV